MKTFNVECPDCGCEMDVNIEESDLADTETNHTVVCADCQTETEYAYDGDLDHLVNVDEEDDEDDEQDEPEEGDDEEDQLA